MKMEEAKNRLWQILANHVGVEKALGMAELFEHVYQRPVSDRINDTRQLRKLVTALRLEGAPIASVTRADGGLWYTSFDEFLYTMELLRRDDVLCRALGGSGLRYCEENYTWPHIEEQYRELIRRVAGGKKNAVR